MAIDPRNSGAPTNIYNKRKLLADSAVGANPILAPNPPQNPNLAVYSPTAPMQAFGQPSATPKMAPNFSLPNDYNFNDLATYEQNTRNALGTQIKSQYDSALQDYKTTTANRRSALASSLNDTAQQTFKLNNPALLEDLNNRGVLSSPTAVANAEAQAMKELTLANQDKLNAFDTNSQTYEDQFTQAGLGVQTQAEQDALDAALNLRSTKLEGDLSNAQTNEQMNLAKSLADKQSRNNLTSTLIGTGGILAGAGLQPNGFLSNLFKNPATNTAATLGTTGSIGGVGAAGTGGTASALLPAAGVAAGLGLYEAGRKILSNQGAGKTTSKVLSAMGPGVGLSVAAGNKALGGKLFGGKTANGKDIADLSISIQGTQQQLLDLKAAVQRGEISPEDYQAQAQPVVDQVAQQVGQMAGRGSVYANAINKVWEDFQNAGLAKNTGHGFIAV